jgi:hypothetical protein
MVNFLRVALNVYRVQMKPVESSSRPLFFYTAPTELRFTRPHAPDGLKPKGGINAEDAWCGKGGINAEDAINRVPTDSDPNGSVSLGLLNLKWGDTNAKSVARSSSSPLRNVDAKHCEM